jgi:hypothetical protein
MGDMVSVGDGHACQHLFSADGRDTRSRSIFADCWSIPESAVTAEPHDDALSDVTANPYDTTYDSANSSDDTPSTSNNDDHDARLGRRRFLTAEIALSEPGTSLSRGHTVDRAFAAGTEKGRALTLGRQSWIVAERW